MFRPYTKDKQFIHHLNKEKGVSKRDVIDIFTCERYIFYSVKTIFLSERNPCNSLIDTITWDIITIKTDSTQRSSNKCKKYLLKTTRSTVTLSMLFETCHFY